MRASEDYILENVVITMTCEINESIKNRKATFISGTIELASLTYDDGLCTSNSTSYRCNTATNTTSFMYMYTPSTTPSSSQSFYCRYDVDGKSPVASENIVIRNAGTVYM